MREIVGHIVALIADFRALTRPTKHDRAKLESLIIAHADIADVEELKLICSSLAQASKAPNTLIIKLCQLDYDICRPLLVASKALSDEDFVLVIENAMDIGHARLVARNKHIGSKTIARLYALNDNKISRSLNLRHGSIFHEVETKAPVNAKIVDSLLDTNIGVVHTALADSLGLSMASAQSICGDLRSRNLPCALHFLQFSEEQAWGIYRSLAKTFAAQPSVEEAFRATYAALTPEETKRTVSTWQLDELVAEVKFSKADNDIMPANSNIKKQSR